MLKIYHARHSRGLRVVWTAEELGVPYELKHLPFNPAALKSDEFLAINPFGALPAIEDGGVRMTESGAICQYLTERYGRAPFARTLADPDYSTYLQWTHAGEATLTPPLSLIVQHTRIRPDALRIPTIAEESIVRFNEYLAVLGRALDGRDYLLGDDCTLPDVVVGYALHLAALLNLMGGAPGTVREYWERLQERPGYRAAAA
ncbi:MAG: glutathione S-transferase family protein [Hyphomonadaceae bacterium]